MAWYFTEARSAEASTVLRSLSGQGALVPELWPIEVANSFRTSIRKGKISTALRARYLAELRLLPIEVETECHRQAWDATLLLSDKHGITVYDAAYLELAVRRRLPLARLDDELAKAAGAEGLEVPP